MYTHRYKLNDEELEHVFEEKNLGVIIDCDLIFEQHMSAKVKTANDIVLFGLYTQAAWSPHHPPPPPTYISQPRPQD